jgi:hypothetical protein
MSANVQRAFFRSAIVTATLRSCLDPNGKRFAAAVQKGCYPFTPEHEGTCKLRMLQQSRTRLLLRIGGFRAARL